MSRPGDARGPGTCEERPQERPMRCEERSSEGGARREELGERTRRAHQPADQPANQPTSQPNFGLQRFPIFKFQISELSRCSKLRFQMFLEFQNYSSESFRFSDVIRFQIFNFQISYSCSQTSDLLSLFYRFHILDFRFVQIFKLPGV